MRGARDKSNRREITTHIGRGSGTTGCDIARVYLAPAYTSNKNGTGDSRKCYIAPRLQREAATQDEMARRDALCFITHVASNPSDLIMQSAFARVVSTPCQPTISLLDVACLQSVYIWSHKTAEAFDYEPGKDRLPAPLLFPSLSIMKTVSRAPYCRSADRSRLFHLSLVAPMILDRHPHPDPPSPDLPTASKRAPFCHGIWLHDLSVLQSLREGISSFRLCEPIR